MIYISKSVKPLYLQYKQFIHSEKLEMRPSLCNKREISIFFYDYIQLRGNKENIKLHKNWL